MPRACRSRRRSDGCDSRRRRSDVINDYRVNGKRSLDEVERRIQQAPGAVLRRRGAWRRSRRRTCATYIVEAAGGDRTTSRAYDVIGRRRRSTITSRNGSARSSGVSNGEINRELTILKRIFNLAVQAGQAAAQAAHPAAARRQHPDGILRAGAVRSVLAPPAGAASARDRVRLHHRLAHRVRGAAAPVAAGRFRRPARCGSTPARRRTAKAACSR